MASTISSVDRTRLGCISPEIAASQAAKGDRDALMANTIADGLDAARADIEALQTSGGGGAGVVYPQAINNYLDQGVSLLGSTATSTGTATHQLTLTGNHARNIDVVLTGSTGCYTGTWTVSGPKTGGGTHSEVLTPPDADGGVTLSSLKTFAAPCTVTLSRTAMANTAGRYTAVVGDNFGLESEAYDGTSGNGNTGHLLSVSVSGGQSTISGNMYIAGPTVSPPNGALVFDRIVGQGLNAIYGGSGFDIAYLAVT